jgi:hypothetical protein
LHLKLPGPRMPRDQPHSQAGAGSYSPSSDLRRQQPLQSGRATLAKPELKFAQCIVRSSWCETMRATVSNSNVRKSRTQNSTAPNKTWRTISRACDQKVFIRRRV